jgi:glycosyltransferase involved in cell wall biosynthesis
MVGTGPLFDVCSKIIKSLHIEASVELKGIVDHDQIPALMQKSAVFVQHSLMPLSGDSEGTPVAILEASAVGLPIVSTRHAGISDAVIHGETGFLVEEGDSDGMAEFVYRLLTNSELAQNMGRKSREHIAENFDMEHSIKRLRHILEQCS